MGIARVLGAFLRKGLCECSCLRVRLRLGLQARLGFLNVLSLSLSLSSTYLRERPCFSERLRSRLRSCLRLELRLAGGSCEGEYSEQE